jgi:hypothetical protein
MTPDSERSALARRAADTGGGIADAAANDPLSRRLEGVADAAAKDTLLSRAARLADSVLARLVAVPVWAQVLGGLLLVAFYAQRIWTVYGDTGLFRRLGFDWGLFYSQASALAAGDIAAMYRVDGLTPYLQRLAPFTATPDVPLVQWPSPYPPLLAAMIAPLTLIPPPLAFGIWTALSVISACHLLWRVHQLVPAAGIGRLGLIFVTTLPLLQTFLLGQPVLFLASALAESYLALRRGADFRGGVWLGLLALKPQYGLVLGVFLLWKRRWWAVAGAALAVGVVVGGSAVVAGPGAVWDYQAAVSAMGAFRDPYAVPGEMINWRSVVVNARPSIGNISGIGLFLALSALTVLATAWATRGPWRPGSAALDLQLAAVLMATFLVSYHSHMHGLVLLTLPLAAVWRIANTTPSLRLSVLGLVFVPTAAFVGVTAVGRRFAIDYNDPLWVVWPVWTAALLVVLLGASLVKLRSMRTAEAKVSTSFERTSPALNAVHNV